jgi:hypothetical protein
MATQGQAIPFPVVGMWRTAPGATTREALTTFTLVGLREKRPCLSVDWQLLTVFEGAWLGLTVSMRASEVKRFSEWLEQPSRATPSVRSNRVLLQALAAGVEAGVLNLSHQRTRPAGVRFHVRFVEPACRYEEQIAQPPPNADRDVAVPIAFPSIFEDKYFEQRAEAYIQYLVALMAHEAVHLVQYLSAVPEQRAQENVGPTSMMPGHHVNGWLEFEAALVERCLTQALLPYTAREDVREARWVSERAQSRSGSATASDKQIDADTMMFDAPLEAQYRALGARMVGVSDERDLETLFAVCAKHYSRAAPISDDSPLTDIDARVGKEALAAVRAASPQFRVNRTLPKASGVAPSGR